MAAIDRQLGDYGSESPARTGFAITPSDDADLTVATRGIYVGGGGDITVDFVDSGTSIVLASVVAGTVLPIRVSRVYSTGTSATNLVGLI